MPRPIKKRSQKTGFPPGTPVHIGERISETTRVTLFDYDKQRVEEKELTGGQRMCPGSGQIHSNLDQCHRPAPGGGSGRIEYLFRITSSGPGGYPEYRPAAEDGRLWRLSVYRFKDALPGRQSGRRSRKRTDQYNSREKFCPFFSVKRKPPF